LVNQPRYWLIDRWSRLISIAERALNPRPNPVPLVRKGGDDAKAQAAEQTLAQSAGLGNN